MRDTLFSCDVHGWPGKQQNAQVKDLCGIVRLKKPPLWILGGDTDDPWKAVWEEVLACETHQMLQAVVQERAQEGLETIVLTDNHDHAAKPEYWPGARLMRWYGEDNWEFRHGWEFDPIWHNFGGFPFWLSMHWPGLAVPIYHAFSQTPNQIKDQNGDKWKAGVDVINFNAKAYSARHNVNLLCGHTHYPKTDPYGGTWFGNAGDWEDSFSWIEIMSDVPSLHKLGE